MAGKRKTGTKKDPCWKGYKQNGTKKKNVKTVPNCKKDSQLISVILKQ